MKAIILVGGKGEKIWPYNEIRNKCMIRISNRPIVDYTVQALLDLNIEEIIICGFSFMDEIIHLYRHEPKITIVEIEENNGNVDTLLVCELEEDFMVLYGDCIIQKEDLSQLIQSQVNTCLLYQVQDDCHHHIIANTKDNQITSFIGHPRGYEQGLSMVGGYFSQSLFSCLKYNRGYFKNTKVGIGSPNEKFIEESLNDFMEKNTLYYVEAKSPVFDIDKPWQILMTNQFMNQHKTKALKENKISENVYIDESARIEGFIQIGKNSKIGRNVWVGGNVIIGEDTVIENGAVIEEGCVIGDRCKIQNHCKVGSYTTIGNDCIVEQTAEIIGGLIMDKNYLYHHMEFFGLCGERSDLGAGCVCGTLRFDDGETRQTINTRKETPQYFSNATYLGDYVRAGVGVIFMPGVMVGSHSVIGAGTILNKNIKSNTLVYPKQELIEKEWSYKKYGW